MISNDLKWSRIISNGLKESWHLEILASKDPEISDSSSLDSQESLNHLKNMGMWVEGGEEKEHLRASQSISKCFQRTWKDANTSTGIARVNQLNDSLKWIIHDLFPSNVIWLECWVMLRSRLRSQLRFSIPHLWDLWRQLFSHFLNQLRSLTGGGGRREGEIGQIPLWITRRHLKIRTQFLSLVWYQCGWG